MGGLSVLYFFIVTFSLGYSITAWTKREGHILEQYFLCMGLGLAVLPLIAIVFSYLHVPFVWWLILALSVIIPLRDWSAKKFFLPSIKMTKSLLLLLVVFGVAAANMYVYYSGAQKYPYLEDSDSWEHGKSVKFVSVSRSVIPERREILNYDDPYPPGYAALFGLLHQTNDSLQWTLKFFNSLIISVGFIFFFLFAKKLMGNAGLAALATVFLGMDPSYLSHFIWAHSYVIVIFFPVMYALLEVLQSAEWFIPATLASTGIFLIQPTKPIKLSIMIIGFFLLYVLMKEKRSWEPLKAYVLAGIISLIWWGTRFKDMFMQHKTIYKSVDELSRLGFFEKAWTAFRKAFDPMSGTATRVYYWKDFWVASPANMINNPIGLGQMLTVLVLAGMVLLAINWKKKTPWQVAMLFWLVFCFLGIHGARLPIGLFAFRFWSLFAIPLSIICAYAVLGISQLLEGFSIPKAFPFGLVIAIVYVTAFVPKMQINTSTWDPGGSWSSIGELQGYMALKEMGPNEHIFSFCPEGGAKILGFDNYQCEWCADELDFKKTFINETGIAVHDFLSSRSYTSAVYDGRCVKKFGINESQEFLTKISQAGFVPTAQQDGFLLLRVV